MLAVLAAGALAAIAAAFVAGIMWARVPTLGPAWSTTCPSTNCGSHR